MNCVNHVKVKVNEQKEGVYFNYPFYNVCLTGKVMITFVPNPTLL